MVSPQSATPEFARLEFTAQSTWQLLVARFTRSQGIPEVAELEYGLLLQNDNAEYARNNVVFYTSARTATQSLSAGQTFYNQYAAADNVVFFNLQSNSAWLAG